MKRKILFGLLLMTSLLNASSLENLESLLSRAKNLDDFLSNPSLQEKYFSALRAYQSRDHFKCESYAQILDQVKLLKQTVPGFSDRLWAEDNSKEFQAVVVNTQGDRQTYTFRPISRGFHRIWFDPSSEGCLTPTCEKTDLYAPDRWTSILQGNHFYALEKDHIFVDSTLLIASLRNGKDKTPIQLVSWTGGPLLTKELRILSSISHLEKNSSLLEYALTQLSYPKTTDKNLFVMRNTQLPEGLVKKELGVYKATSKKEKNKKVSLADLSLPDSMASQLR
jgi:hypothetical protein